MTVADVLFFAGLVLFLLGLLLVVDHVVNDRGGNRDE